MISGTVNAKLEATLAVRVYGANGREETVGAIIDTGFAGFLTLPAALVEALQLPWMGRQSAVLADGRVTLLEVHEAMLSWDGRARLVEINVVDGRILIGMHLLEGYQLHVDVMVGGSVSITEI